MERRPWTEPDDTAPRCRGWEWPGLAEFLAKVVFVFVVLGAAAGMVLGVLAPARRARQLGQAVGRVADGATEAARDVVNDAVSAEGPAHRSM